MSGEILTAEEIRHRSWEALVGHAAHREDDLEFVAMVDRIVNDTPAASDLHTANEPMPMPLDVVTSGYLHEEDESQREEPVITTTTGVEPGNTTVRFDDRSSITPYPVTGDPQQARGLAERFMHYHGGGADLTEEIPGLTPADIKEMLESAERAGQEDENTYSLMGMAADAWIYEHYRASGLSENLHDRLRDAYMDGLADMPLYSYGCRDRLLESERTMRRDLEQLDGYITEDRRPFTREMFAGMTTALDAIIEVARYNPNELQRLTESQRELNEERHGNDVVELP